MKSVESEAASADLEPPPKKARADCEIEGDDEIAASASSSRMPAAAAPSGTRQRSRSPVPAILRANLARAQETQLQEMATRATSETPVEVGNLNEPGAFDAWVTRLRERKRLEIDEDEAEFYAFDQGEDGKAHVMLAARNDEFDMKKATPEDVAGFKVSDSGEWNSVTGMNAVKVWKGAEAQRLREIYGSRILKSRLVRRKKPMPGIGNFKYKSRWCVLGFADPDGDALKTFAATPQTEVINMFFQAAASLKLKVVFGDVTAAFCQSRPLARTQGRLFAEPTPGLPGVEPGDLIELLVAVYGLDDAPCEWAETVGEHLIEQLKFKRSLLDPCLFIKRRDDVPGPDGVQALVLVEVDDFNFAVRGDYEDTLLSSMKERFRFGKWEYGEADFNGRHVKVTAECTYMNQEKYIIEKIKALELSRGRKSDKSSPLTPSELDEFRSMLYKISWVAHQTRPEASGMVSLLSSRLQQATVEDAIIMNKMVGHLRSTARQGIKIFPIKPEEMTFIGVSDAGGVDGNTRGTDESGMIEDPVQGAWLVLAGAKIPTHDSPTKVSVLSWRSTKLKRRVTSTLASETLSFSQCMGEIEWLQVLYRDMIYGDVNPAHWCNSIAPFNVF